MEKILRKDKSRETLALVLIGLGILWVMKQMGVFHHFPFVHVNNLFAPVRHAFQSFGHFIFSWPAILIIAGIILMAGRRSVGVVFLVIGLIFIIPKFFFLPGITIVIAIPIILIGVGIALITRII